LASIPLFFNNRPIIRSRNPMNTTDFQRLTRRPALWLLALLLSATATVSHAVPLNETYAYDAINRLTTAGTASYQYDAAGNLLQMTSPGTQDLFATPTTVTLAYTANSNAQISLTSNVSWTATSNQTWLTVAPGSGTTNATLTVTATTANPTVNTRSGTVTITGSGLTSTVTITQDGMPPPGTLTVTPTNSTVPSTSAAGLSFSVTSTNAWTAISSQPWLTLSNSNGPGNGTLTFSITANTTAAVRSATVNLTSGTLTATYTLNQQAPNTDDHGGSIATATIIPTTASSATGIITIGDEDFFRITIPGPGILIAWTEGTTDTYGYIYNATGIELKHNDDSDLEFNCRVSSAVDAGNFYVRIRGFDEFDTGPYTLRTRFITSTAPIQISFLEKDDTYIILGFPSIVSLRPNPSDFEGGG
jgi:YD repeat-containing protein